MLRGSPSRGKHCFTTLKDTVLKGSFGYNRKRYLSVFVRIRSSCGWDLSTKAAHGVCGLLMHLQLGRIPSKAASPAAKKSRAIKDPPILTGKSVTASLACAQQLACTPISRLNSARRRQSWQHKRSKSCPELTMALSHLPPLERVSG
jgi:hypothetical protein